MKNIMRRGLAAVLSLVMALGLLSGCGSSEYDPIKEAFKDMGLNKDTVMMTLKMTANEEEVVAEVTAEDVFFWMAQNADYVASYFDMMGMERDWSNTMGGSEPMDEYVKEQSKQSAIMYSVVLAMGEAYGYTMTEDDKAAYAEDLAAAQEQMGGEESYQEFLKTMLITDSGMERLSSVGMIYEHMAAGFFQEGGELAPTTEDLAAYAQEQDLLCAKHILVMTQDMATGQALPAEEAAAKKAAAEDILAQLQAIQDPAELAAKFDELMNEHSEDTGLAAYPNGYVFGAGEMVPEFEEATRALEPGQISGLVESSYGYHIILRQDPGQAEEIRTGWEAEAMNAQVQQWIEEAVVETSSEWDSLTTEAFYDALEAYREAIAPAEEETQEEAAQEEPAEETEGEPAQEESTGEEPAQETEGETPAEGETTTETIETEDGEVTVEMGVTESTEEFE